MAKSLKETLGYNTKTITSLFDNNAAIRRQQQKFQPSKLMGYMSG
ncbi:hypothetical protein DERF_007062 [Dermatophagoides farinae]|uniref:Uncharacterized protein n=1 Tax=Dermatophagoides farinae TaxID=6954 RepID=A0A922L393_DERFA|nr:hypothetical protein DERF_007062 [Dermatophagoides farinae]